MSQSFSANASQEIPVALAPWSTVSRRLIATALVLVLAHLPLLIFHGQSLWAREHYQFFPLLLPAAFVLGSRNVHGLGPFAPGRRSVCLALFGVALAFLTLGILIYSHWLGAVAAQVTLLAVAFSLGGRPLVRCLLPAWLLLFLALPLPLPLDDRFIAALQRLTSIGASRVLEFVGVLHAREGNVLDLGGHCLLVEEACSGIHSLYSVLACTLFWSAWTRRPVGHSLLLLLTTLPWVLAGNVARIVAVATLDGIGGVNLSSGWAHEALGVCLFAVMLGLIWSTDHLLLLLTPIMHFFWGELWWNLTATKVQYHHANVDRNPPAAEPPPAVAGSEHPWLPPLAATALSAWPILACYGVLALAQVGALASQIAGFSRASLAPIALPADTVQGIESLEEDTMPQRFETWKRARFEINATSVDHSIGLHSRSWRYLSGDRSALASIFYPYRGWKEVKNCYSILGWIVQNRVIHNGDPTSETGPYVTVHLYEPAKRSYGYLMFQNRDSSDQPLAPPGERLSDVVWTRLAVNQSWRNLTGRATPPELRPTYLVQLFVESQTKFDKVDEQKAEALYRQMLRVLPK